MWEVRRVGDRLAGEDGAVNRTHYLRSSLLAGLSPLSGDRGGRSYLSKADNPEDSHSRDPQCPARWIDSIFTPPDTPSHLALLLSVGVLKLNSSLSYIPNYIDLKGP